ncbi:Bug family tripartite tricarboxylate transporter substrate binding protein [Phyllobacterium lublinensis]|jgi:tripartite-type tricarboxylate transporter receptor subunit TctC|uniref:Bug family tripartite tricarboxylate transporter substrate binding protein n=1 Tax=Phyllobacterium lublinensis TaxID=2875708 RepID=UPI001CCD0830|nr:tripartite tricarboxylate transporter substrate-binding protein [Phyllobacterium sp. 2063]MBZ9653743.1 hypothetical protein [Phyllobacterium sp. 2063]
MKLLKMVRIAGAVFGAGLVLTGAAQAQTVEEFYKGKNLTFIISAAAGGSTDFFGRAFAKYYAKHIPGQPNVIVVNQPGAGGLLVGTQLQTTQPRDGTVVALLQRNNLYLPLVSDENKEFDPRKVNWLGSLNKEEYAITSWETSPVKKTEDLFTTQMTMGATGYANETRTIPALMNEYLGTKFDIVMGYQGSEEVGLAMERGEVNGKAGTVSNLATGAEAGWVKDGKLKVLMQIAMQPNPSLPEVPNIMTYIKDPDVKSLFTFMVSPFEAGRPMAAPPEVPADRLEALRKAFDDAAADPEFIADLKKVNSTVEPVSGVAVQEIVENLYKTPQPVLDKVKALIKKQ